MSAKSDNELHNLWCGDYLSCQGCGHIIYAAPLVPFTFKFRDITKVYWKHAEKCMSLKKLIVQHRREQNDKEYQTLRLASVSEVPELDQLPLPQ